VKHEIQDLLQLLEKIAPTVLSEEWDNPGLQVGSPSGKMDRIVLSLDPTLDAVEETIRLGAQVLLCHHPLLFRPVTQLDRDHYPGDVITRALAGSVSIVAAHTNLDAADGGINDILARVLRLQGAKPLPVGPQHEAKTLGRIGTLADPVTLERFAANVKNLLSVTKVRFVGDSGSLIRTVAVVGGAGGGSISGAHSMGADALVTGDVTHHQALEARQCGLALIDAGHFSTERIAFIHFAEILKEALAASSMKVDVSVFEEADPFSYE
jgi:dinuclear metal center YbgI/SA1388 family protein